MRRPAGSCSSTKRVNRSMENATSLTWKRCGELGLPFWLAGGYGSAEKLREALAAGATGVQVGTAFAFCAESGLRDDYKQALLKKAISGEAKVFTDPLASPTGYPFKIAQLEDTLSEREVYVARPRVCDLGYLREAYRTPAGTIDYRCAGEPLSVYLSKGGKAEDTAGRKCLCNALVANIGLPQVRGGKYVEKGVVTSGDDLTEIPSFLSPIADLQRRGCDCKAGSLDPARDVVVRIAFSLRRSLPRNQLLRRCPLASIVSLPHSVSVPCRYRIGPPGSPIFRTLAAISLFSFVMPRNSPAC